MIHLFSSEVNLGKKNQKNGKLERGQRERERNGKIKESEKNGTSVLLREKRKK